MPPFFVIPYPIIDPVLVEIGPLSLRWYALAYIVGIVAGWWYIRRIVRTPRLWGPGGAPLTARHIDDFVIFATIGIIAGGRLGYVLIYDLPRFAAEPLSVFALWEGGMSFHGGFAGIVAAMLLFARVYRVRAWSLIDVAAAAAPIGLLLGRLTNFINAELYGRPSDVPWAMVFPTDPLQLPRHPSQLYEAGLEGIVLFAVLWALVYRGGWLTRPGFVAGAFAAGYGIVRVFAEVFREPDVQIGFLAGGTTIGMLLSIPMIVAGAVVMVWSVRRRPRPIATGGAGPGVAAVEDGAGPSGG